MKQKYTNIIVGFAIFLLILIFNPIFSSSLYFDATGAYTFLSLSKVSFLILINIVLYSIWAIVAFKKREVKILSARSMLYMLSFVLVSLISLIVSSNKTNSFVGFNSTLANSFIELAMVFGLVFFIVNNVKSRKSIYTISRYILTALSFAFIWVLFRFGYDEVFRSVYWREFLNSRLFSPTGKGTSLVVFSLFSLILSTFFILKALKQKKLKLSLGVDTFNLVIASCSFFVLSTLEANAKNYTFILLGAFFFIILGILFASYKSFKPSILPTLMLIVIGIGGGFFLNKAVFKDNVKNLVYPALSYEQSFNITLDAMKGQTAKKFLIGDGQGNFAYSFDQYKTAESAKLNLNTINTGSPLVGETRYFDSGSYVLDIFHGMGVMGVVAFFASAISVIALAYKKLQKGFRITPVAFMLGYLTLLAGVLFKGYDFTLVLLLWIMFAFNVVLLHKGSKRMKLNLSLGKAQSTMNSATNYSFTLPLIYLGVAIGFLFYTSNIFLGNISIFWARVFRDNGNITEYINSSMDAVDKYSNSDIFTRELANGAATRLIPSYAELAQSAKKENLTDDEKKNLAATLVDLDLKRVTIINALNDSIKRYPQEYRNYYFIGSLNATLSEYTNLQYDADAINAYEIALVKNRFHAPTHYQLSLLYERAGRFNESFANIDAAYKLNPNDIYLIKYADNSVNVKSYDSAKAIYEQYKKVYAENPNNTQLKNFYETFQIDKKLEELNKLIEKAKEEEKKQEVTPTPTQVPTATETTPTPTKKK